MKNTRKRLISTLLTLAMAIGLLAAIPLTVFAGGSGVNWTKHPQSQTVPVGQTVTFSVTGIYYFDKYESILTGLNKDGSRRIEDIITQYPKYSVSCAEGLLGGKPERWQRIRSIRRSI